MMSAGSPQTPSASQQPIQEEQAPWYMKSIARAEGTLGGLIAMALGLWACVTLTPKCLVMGMLQMLFGFLTITLEAPCLCLWFDFIGKIQNFSDSRKAWHKAILYLFMGILPIAVCPETATIFGSGLIAVCGVIYGIMSFGKKADRETMMARAGNNDAWDANLVDSEKNPNNYGP